MPFPSLLLAATATPSSWGNVLTAVLQILGALGVFLFGMKVMSEGIQKVGGGRMRQALATMTKNRFTGMLTGLVLTGIIQSSSATTVLVVSFVNAGLLTLTESIGIIMGANLGTTLTAWIVALVGKFSLSAIAIPIVGIGLPFFFIGKDKGKNFGEFLIGFGLLFFGLHLLKEAVPSAGDIQESNAFFHFVHSVVEMGGMRAVLVFLFGGILLTVVVQSSSAAMAITVMCATKGWFGDDAFTAFKFSAAIVLGENIGTTITAWLASLGANTNAKRAARAHFLFNVIGVTWMLVAFALFTQAVWWLAGELPASLRSVQGTFQQSEIAFSTAIFHSLFNLTNIALLIWFVPQLAKVVSRWVKDPPGAPGRQRLSYISQRFVDLGELNLAEAETATRRMGDLACGMLQGCIDLMNHPETDLSTKVGELKQSEDDCDLMLHDLTEYLVACSTHEIGQGNANRIAAMLRAASEYEEATDRIYRLVKVLQRKYEKSRKFTDEQQAALTAHAESVLVFLKLSRDLTVTQPTAADLSASKEREKEIDAARKRLNKEAMARMSSGGDVPTEMLQVDLSNHLEAIGNHAHNIVEAWAGIGRS